MLNNLLPVSLFRDCQFLVLTTGYSGSFTVWPFYLLKILTRFIGCHYSNVPKVRPQLSCWVRSWLENSWLLLQCFISNVRIKRPGNVVLTISVSWIGFLVTRTLCGYSICCCFEICLDINFILFQAPFLVTSLYWQRCFPAFYSVCSTPVIRTLIKNYQILASFERSRLNT